MGSLKEEILKRFQSLDQLRYAIWEPTIFNKDDSIRDVKEALDYHCPDHTISSVLFQQLVELTGSGVVNICGYNHPYEIKDIYWTMERVICGKVKNKPFNRKHSYIANKNVYHTHHSEAFYSMMNCIRYFERYYNSDKSINARLSQLKCEYPNRSNYMEIFANEILLNSIEWSEKTGEWLVYQINDDQINFLCLYIHDYNDLDDKKLYSLIKNDLDV